MKVLTKAELQIMNALWRIQKGFLKEVLAALPDPKPAKTTVATMLKILVEKGFVTFEAQGKAHVYKPLVTKKQMAKRSLSALISDFFKGSPDALMSFMVEETMDLEQLEQTKQLLNKKMDAHHD